jgi:hypothetical protein
MKKLLVLSFVAGLIVLASCGSGNKPAATTDTTKVKVVEKPAVDTTHKAAVDTTKK